MNNHYKITFWDLRNVIRRHCLDLISKAHEYENSHPMAHSCTTSLDLRWSGVKDPVEILLSGDEIFITFELVSERFKTKFRFTKDHAYHTMAWDTVNPNDFKFDIYEPITMMHVEEAAVLLLIYQHLAHIYYSRLLAHQTSPVDVGGAKTGGVEIDEEEYAKHHTDDIKNSCTVNSFTDDKDLDSFIHLTSDDGLFTLELNATEVDDGKKDEVYASTLTSTIIRMSDYSHKETFLNHIKNILSREFPKATEDIFSRYYDSIPREPDLTTKISNILREAGVDESKIPDTTIALIDTMVDPDNE